MSTFNDQDLKQLQQQGVSPETAENQLKRFETGYPYLRLNSSATVGRGIIRLSPQEEYGAKVRWRNFLAQGGKVAKFVPASGAASRMFKELFAFGDGDTDTPKPGSAIEALVKDYKNLPFYGELDEVTKKLYGQSVDSLIEAGKIRDFVNAIVRAEGMNYGQLPKALLTFHKYADGITRTSLEEQLAEGAQTAASSDGKVHIHFTVSANHRKLFEEKLKEVVPAMEKKFKVKYVISLSEQKPSTDTIAGDASAKGKPFRDDAGKLIFRPGGHGALIENLNDLDSEVVFIKNIDNVVPDTLRESTVEYKKILGGVLMTAYDKITWYLVKLGMPEKIKDKDLDEMNEFAHEVLNIHEGAFEKGTKEERIEAFKKVFDRPIRVCGMVVNEGEPGGGPFIAYNADGSASPQILESSQIDMTNPESKAMMSNATHFNPVDLVCRIARADGSKYNLPDFVDPSTGFISSKSAGGKELLALELPGLWNGAMSNWSTIFVEVPASTFNPVKTVNDLLRPAHQG